MRMIFEQLHIGGDKNLGYIVGDEKTRELAIVDPGANPYMLLDRAHELGGTVTHVIATHSHYDHIAGVDDILRKTEAKYAAYQTVDGADIGLTDGQTLHIGSVPIKIIFCPGHCRDSILLLCDNQKLIVGDELFIGGVGITRSEQQARLHYRNLHDKLLALDDDLEVYPGHDYGEKPRSTIGEQRRTNPYLLQPDFDSFWHLRQNWKQYIKEHNIPWG